MRILQFVILFLLFLVFIIIIWQNLTQGHFQIVGCCGSEVKYTSDSEANRSRSIEVCGYVKCAIPEYSSQENFLLKLSALDLNR